MATKFAGANWLASATGITPSPIGREAADIVGQVLRGLYHLGGRDLRASVWTDTHYAEVRLGHGSLATYDSSRLTELVILCHDRCVRVDIDARAKGYLSLLFHQRRREGGYSERHPTMEAALATVRENLALDHYETLHEDHASSENAPDSASADSCERKGGTESPDTSG